MDPCGEVGCDEPAGKSGLCKRHRRNAYMREYSARGGAGPCSVDGCERTMYGRSGLCAMHYKRREATGETGEAAPRFLHASEEERLGRFVDRRGDDECWPWTGHLVKGYGMLDQVGAHRRVYELLVGPIPDGLHLDHLCHTADPSCPAGEACLHRRCVNPAHLEPVTREENNRRAGSRLLTCRRGHDLTDPANYKWESGRRRCRQCKAIWRRARYLRTGT